MRICVYLVTGIVYQMVRFKIRGERNSGTTFLERLLTVNHIPTDSQVETNGICYHWKHGAPTDLIQPVIDIFIFRRLEEWLVSMSKNPYHLFPFKDFSAFLTTRQQSCETFLLDHQTMRRLNEDDNDKTIFDIRYYKFNAMMDYTNKRPTGNIVFVNLSYLQENTPAFLNALNARYLNLSDPSFITEMNHTKDPALNAKNRTYDIVISDYQDIVDARKNKAVEDFINHLEMEFF